MNFEEFKKIMNELKELGYVKIKEYNDHIYVYVKEQENEENRELIVKKIKDIYTKSEGSIGYKYLGYEMIFIETKELIKCFYEENYKKIAEKIDEANISYMSGYVTGKGTEKSIKLSAQEYYGIEGIQYRCRNDFEDEIIRIIAEQLPNDMTINVTHQRIFTKKAKEWEEKRKNCAEIKISEDFDKILSKY